LEYAEIQTFWNFPVSYTERSCDREFLEAFISYLNKSLAVLLTKTQARIGIFFQFARVFLKKKYQNPPLDMPHARRLV